MASSPEATQPADNSPSPPVDSSTPPPSPPLPPPESPPAPPTTATPPPSDSSPSPPTQPSPQSPPPPTTPDQSPPPPENTDTPTTSGSPPVFAPPAFPPPVDKGDPLTPPSPALPRSPPRSRPENGSPRSTPKQSPPSSSSDNKELSVILGIIFGGLVALLLIFVFLKWWRKRKRQQYYLEHGLPIKVDDQYHKGPKQQKATMDSNAPYGGGGYPYPMASGDYSSGQYPGAVPSPTQKKVMGSFGGMCEFTYEALAAATGDFSQANVLGQGGFGYVHKGTLPDGTVVAVKSLKAGSGQGEREFQAEVEIISRVHHRYLVTLVGYCIARGQRMLVYEFVPNNTLEFHLHGKDRPVMDWAARRRIAVGSAKGLAYLHEDCHPRIIHRDIKSANILLDNNFEAKVADFGLAKLTTDNYTHVSTRVMGTFGYLAPEYAASGKLTEKSDVFSFGVMLLELITGRRPIDPTNIMEDSLVDWARPLMTKALETGNYSELVDERLKDNYDRQEMARMIACAAASIRHSARKRPRMSQIVRALDGNASLDDLNEGVKPGESAVYNPYDTGAYNADIMRFRKMVLSTDDFTSGPTNNYGLNQSPGGSSSDSREMGLPSPIQKPNQ